MATKTKLPDRSEVLEEYTWKMEDMFSSDEAWEEEYQKLEKEMENLSSFQGTLENSAEALYQALRFYSDIACRMERIIVYANQKLHQDTRNGKYQGFAGKAKNLGVKFDGISSYLEPELLEIQEEQLKEYLADNKMAEFKQYIGNLLRQKEHVLSKEIEKILSMTGEFSDTADDVYSMFNNADIKFPSVTDENGEEVLLSHGTYISYLENKDRRVRKEALEKYYIPYQEHENVLASLYAANAKKDAFYAKVRHYSSAREASLKNSNIPLSVYDNLIKAVHESFPIFYKYMALRKRALQVEKLHMYDIYVPLIQEQEKKITFEKAKEMVKEGLKPMGEEYLKKLEEGFQNRWIDVYENQGKRSGAYSWGAYGVHPYVLLNYHDSLDNVFTLAHEMGHALHSYYSDANQTYMNAAYKLFVAEVASTCNESLLIQDMLKKTEDRKEKMYLINYFLDKFKGTMFRQTMFAEFEKITHEMVEQGENLTKEGLKKIYHELNELYFGPDVVIDEQIDMEWARIPHFYNSFYVYQYATGFSAAIALSKRILELGEAGVKDYMKFLTGGCSKYPIELLRDAGVDMESTEPVKEAIEVFQALVKQLEELMDEEDGI